MPIQYIPYASLKIKINARRANKQQRETYMVRQTSAAFSIKKLPSVQVSLPHFFLAGAIRAPVS